MHNDLLNVLWASRTKYPQNWGIKSHKHNCFQLFYIVSGKCQFIINDTAFEVEQNHYIIVLPNEEHLMKKSHENLVRMIDIKFEVMNKPLAQRVHEIKRSEQTSETISYIFKFISNEMNNMGPNNRDIIEAYIYIFLLKMIPSLNNKDNTMIITGINEEEWPQLCKNITQYFKGHYSKNITLEEIADYLGYNKNYVCGIFKRYTGLTIMDYLKLVRIERACELIEMSDYTFQQISFMVGFNSIHNFNKVFKQIIKSTPGEYKRSLIEKNNAVKQETFKNEDNYDVL